MIHRDDFIPRFGSTAPDGKGDSSPERASQNAEPETRQSKAPSVDDLKAERFAFIHGSAAADVSDSLDSLADYVMPQPDLERPAPALVDWSKASRRISSRFLNDAGPRGSRYHRPGSEAESDAVKRAVSFMRRRFRDVRVDEDLWGDNSLSEMNHTVVREQLIKRDPIRDQYLVRLLVDIRNADGNSIVPFGDSHIENHVRWQEHKASPVHLQVDLEIPSRAELFDSSLGYDFDLSILYSEEAFLSEIDKIRDGVLELPEYGEPRGSFLVDFLSQSGSRSLGVEGSELSRPPLKVRHVLDNREAVEAQLDSPHGEALFVIFEVSSQDDLRAVAGSPNSALPAKSLIRLTLDAQDSGVKWDKIDVGLLERERIRSHFGVQ